MAHWSEKLSGSMCCVEKLETSLKQSNGKTATQIR